MKIPPQHPKHVQVVPLTASHRPCIHNYKLNTTQYVEMHSGPIPKGMEKDQVGNYRPISLLSILSKVLETHMAKLIKEHLHTANHSFVNQWGFQKGKSTTLGLLSTVHQWHLYLEEHKKVYATFLDLKKAFDTLLHRSPCLQVLNLYFIPMTSWCITYLLTLITTYFSRT